MKYLDLTSNSSEENNLSLDAIKAIIQSCTGRKLIFEDSELTKQYDHLFKLVRFPNPIGFAIVANQRIPKDTVLCPYGGETCSESQLENNNDIKYLLSCTDQNTGMKILQQAKMCGDLGSLFAHLPNLEFLENIGLSHAKIQANNIKVFYDFVKQPGKEETARLFFISTQNIDTNAVIGFDYGLEYWIESKISPSLFHHNKSTLIDIAQLNFNKQVAAFCDQSGKTRIYNRADPKHQIIVAYALETVLLAYKKTLMNDPQSSLIIFQTMQHHLALSIQEINRVLQEEKLSDEKHIFLFFKTTQITGCAPPPNSRVENGITIV